VSTEQEHSEEEEEGDQTRRNGRGLEGSRGGVRSGNKSGQGLELPLSRPFRRLGPAGRAWTSQGARPRLAMGVRNFSPRALGPLGSFGGRRPSGPYICPVIKPSPSLAAVLVARHCATAASTARTFQAREGRSGGVQRLLEGHDSVHASFPPPVNSVSVLVAYLWAASSEQQLFLRPLTSFP
jgi:hypothetical protein